MALTTMDTLYKRTKEMVRYVKGHTHTHTHTRPSHLSKPYMGKTEKGGEIRRDSKW